MIPVQWTNLLYCAEPKESEGNRKGAKCRIVYFVR
jgi:hypothetical protein